MPIVTRKGNLFDVPSSKDILNVLVHAGNAQGVWGAGVAAEFKRRFPTAFEVYKESCYRNAPSQSVGSYTYCEENGYGIVTLITSENFGHLKDDVDDIVTYTRRALGELFEDFTEGEPRPHFHSPKFNAGLFAVPWEKTFAALQDLNKRYDYPWTVWEL